MQTMLEMPGYTIREAEKILGCGEKYIYRLIRDGKIEAYTDDVGQKRISYGELYAYMKSKEKGA